MTASRRRQGLHKQQQNAPSNAKDRGEKSTGMSLPSPRIINAGPSLEKAEMYGIVHDSRPAFSRFMALAGRVFIETIPQWLTVGAMLVLIFGGCCSNVFALESIIKVEPASGLLLTFIQFLFVAAVGLPSHLDPTWPPFILKQRKVPIRRYMVNILLFCSVNVLNNHAFRYNISVPLHIILRSGGSITTMAAGSLAGKKYSRMQMAAALLLTVGVITAAWADALSTSPSNEAHDATSTFGLGLAILFGAQVLSAIMGLFTEETYRLYGPQWKENLFYSHLLSLPFFIPFFPSLQEQFMKLAKSPPLQLPLSLQTSAFGRLWPNMDEHVGTFEIPSQLFFLTINVLTQYACIRGVNVLAAVSSALTVTIVLNIRKLVSLLLSIWLFGNHLAPGTLVGAGIVFFAGSLYSLDNRRKPPARTKAASVRAG